MTDQKMTRRRALQLIAGTVAGVAAQRLLPIEAAAYPASKTTLLAKIERETIVKYALVDMPHGTVPRGLLSVPQVYAAPTPPPHPPGPGQPGQPGRPNGPAPHDAPPGQPTLSTATAIPTVTVGPTTTPTPSPLASANSGRFGRMFPNLVAFGAAADDLKRLAATMIEIEKADGTGPVETDDPASPSNNPLVPAGFTYVGQFLDHDLTFDPTPMSATKEEVSTLVNFRTPRFDLDSVYAGGPDAYPFLYQNDGVKLLVGKNKSGEDDLPRNSEDDDARALTGDPRNDENLIVSQLQLAFIKYHNRAVDEIGQLPALFEDARQMVRWHYQWIILHEFLPQIVGQALVDTVLKHKPQFFAVGNQPFMPVEFSGAAYRFGHSMIRANYSLNALTTGNNADDSPKEIAIFDPTDAGSVTANDLRGFRRRPANRQIDWSHFFAFPGKEDNMQLSRALDTQLSHGLGGLPVSVVGEPPPSLAERNLKRGVMLGLPSGQAVARAMGLPDDQIVTVDNAAYRFQIGTGYTLNGKSEETVPPLAAAEKAYLEGIFGRETPLWYYILKEAELIGKGRQLGPVGGRIVAEVFIGLLLADPTAYLVANPNWQPTNGHFGSRKDGQFSMVDLLNHIQ